MIIMNTCNTSACNIRYYSMICLGGNSFLYRETVLTLPDTSVFVLVAAKQ